MTEKEELIKKFKEKHGRNPPKLSPQKISQLEQAFLDGLSDTEACIFADVARTNFYWYQEVNPDFVDRKEALRANNTILSKQALSSSIRKGDIGSVKYWLERKVKEEFSLRTETTGKDGKDLQQVIIIKDDIKRSKPKKGKS